MATTSITDFARLSRRGQIRRLRRVAEQALVRFNIDPKSLSLLNHSYHTTFAVTGSEGRRYVLHVLRPDSEPIPESRKRARIESELWWLDRLRADLAISIPEAVRTPTGEGVVSAGIDGVPEERLCTLFHWMNGRSMYRRLRPHHLAQVGRLTARLHDHSSHPSVPDWFDRPRIDRVDEGTEEQVARLFSDQVSREAARVVREAFRHVQQAQAALGDGPNAFGVIHADIHQKNYMFSDSELRLIDFGDCGWGQYLYDLGVTLQQLTDLPQIATLRVALIAGYREVRDLGPDEEALIDVFSLLREVQDLTWFLTARDDPVYASQAGHVREWIRGIEARLAGVRSRR